MSPSVAFRVVASSNAGDAWFPDEAAAHAAAARDVSIAPDQVNSMLRRITVDPVVVRHEGARWRSRQVWNLRTAAGSVQIFEMLLIDEELYDH